MCVAGGRLRLLGFKAGASAIFEDFLEIPNSGRDRLEPIPGIRNLAPGPRSRPRGLEVGPGDQKLDAGVKLAGPPARFARHGRESRIGNKPWPLGTSVIQICDRFSTFSDEKWSIFGSFLGQK